MALFPGQMFREQLQIAGYGAEPSSPTNETERDADDFGREAFSVTDLATYKSGVQRNLLMEDPGDPNSEKAKRDKTAAQAQDAYEAFEAYAYRQEWLSASHDFSGVSITGAELSTLADRIRKDPKYVTALKDGMALRGINTPEEQAAALRDVLFYEKWAQKTPQERAKFGITDEALDRAKNSPGAKAVIETHNELYGYAPKSRNPDPIKKEDNVALVVDKEARGYRAFASDDEDLRLTSHPTSLLEKDAKGNAGLEVSKPAVAEAAHVGQVEPAAVRPAAFKPDF